MIKAVLFDLWGTLVTSALSDNVSNEIIQLTNLKDRKEFWKHWGKCSIKPFENLGEVVNDFCKSINQENKSGKILKLFKNIENDTKIYDDVYPTLSFLKNKFKLGLITNTDAPSFQIAEKKLDMKFFDVIVTSFETGLLKPQPEIFKLATEKIKVELNECVVVGNDFEVDIKIPKKLGMTTVFIDRKNIKEKIDADYSIKNLLELKKILSS